MIRLIPSNPRVAVIIPPIRDFYVTPHRMSSLGVKILERLLKNAGCTVCCINGCDPASMRQLPLPKTLAYLKPHIIPGETGRCSFFTRFRHFGKSYQAIIDELAAFNPELCLIGCFAYAYAGPVLELADLIRAQCPQTVILTGGAGVSAYPDFFLRSESIDYTLCGEAEVTIPPFLEFIRNPGFSPERVPYLGWKTGTQRRYSPSATYTDNTTLMPIIVRTTDDNRPTSFTASLFRGCAVSCRFCSNHLVHGRQFRHCSIERFNEVLAGLPAPARDNIVSFNFEDDNPLCDYPFFMEAVEACRRALPGVRFTAENGLDHRLMTPRQCEALIDAGFSRFNFTVGSTAPSVLGGERRDFDPERYDALLSIAARRGVPVVSYIICGFPGDTAATVAGNLRFLMNRDTAAGMSLFYPVPGMAGFTDPRRFDAASPQLCAASSAYPWGGSLDTAALVTAFRLARFINLLKSPEKSSEEKLVIERTFVTRRLHTVIRERGQRKIIEVPVQDAHLVRMVLGEERKSPACARAG